MGSSPCNITESMDDREFPMIGVDNMNPRLYNAARRGNMEHLTSIMEVDCAPDLTLCLTPQKNTVLHIAVKFEKQDIVQRIIQLCPPLISQPNSKGDTPLHVLIKDRVKYKEDRIKSPHFRVVEILLDTERNFIPQADCFGNSVLHYASAKTYRRVLEDEFKDRFWSQEDDQIKILERLLQASPSLAYVPKRNGDFPLFIAIRNDFSWAVDTILEHCPDSAELVNQKGQNALHLAVMEKNRSTLLRKLLGLSKLNKQINEPDNDRNTPMHLATLTNQEEMVRLLIDMGTVDLTMSSKEGLTAMDICGYTETEHTIRDALRVAGAIPCRSLWQERFPISFKPPPPPKSYRSVKFSPSVKSTTETLPIVTTLITTVTFATAFAVPEEYKIRGALQAFVLSDILAFCSSMVATILLVYANALSENAFLISYALQMCYYVSGVAVLATLTTFVTAVYVFTSKESLWLAVTALLLGFSVPLFLFYYKRRLDAQKWKNSQSGIMYSFIYDV